MRVLSQERFNLFLEYSKKVYNWEEILREFNISEFTDKGDQLEVTCPFHDDRRPSLRLSKSTGVYHCFSCGRKGTYTRFMWEMNGNQGNYANFCEMILKQRIDFQVALSFNSLFITEKTLDSEFNNQRIFDKTKIQDEDLPLSVLYKRVKALDGSWNGLVASLLMLQQDIKPSDILTVMSKRHIKTNSTQERISISSMLEENDYENRS